MPYQSKGTIKFPLREDGTMSLDFDHLSLVEQELIWILSRESRVIYQDVNGEWWDILDCTEGEIKP